MTKEIENKSDVENMPVSPGRILLSPGDFQSIETCPAGSPRRHRFPPTIPVAILRGAVNTDTFVLLAWCLEVT